MNIFFKIGFAVGYVRSHYCAGRDLALSLPVPKFRSVEEDVKLSRVRDMLTKDPHDSIIGAVKLHRELFNSSLREAVDAVREMKANL